MSSRYYRRDDQSGDTRSVRDRNGVNDGPYASDRISSQGDSHSKRTGRPSASHDHGEHHRNQDRELSRSPVGRSNSRRQDDESHKDRHRSRDRHSRRSHSSYGRHDSREREHDRTNERQKRKHYDHDHDHNHDHDDDDDRRSSKKSHRSYRDDRSVEKTSGKGSEQSKKKRDMERDTPSDDEDLLDIRQLGIQEIDEDDYL
jgi:hypothetical protein